MRKKFKIIIIIISYLQSFEIKIVRYSPTSILYEKIELDEIKETLKCLFILAILASVFS